MKKFLSLLLAVAISLSLVACGSNENTQQSGGNTTGGNASSTSTETITLDMISCLGDTHKIYRFVELYAQMVEWISNGQMKINLLGGDEVMAEDEMLSALKNGVFDLMLDNETLSQICPLYSAMSCTGMANNTEEMEAGLYDLYREVYEKEGGVYWLGKGSQPQWWVLASNKPVTCIADISGMKIRCNSATSAAVEALGGVPTVIEYAEIYEAMERGVIDGFLMTPEDWVMNSWQDVTAYFCDLRVLFGGMTGVLCNLDLYNSLTEEQQGWLKAPLEEYADIFYSMCYHNQSSGEDEMVEAGVQKIVWDQSEKDKATELIIDAQWASLKDKITPEYAQRFAEICGLDY